MTYMHTYIRTIYIYIYTHTCVCMYIYIYIYVAASCPDARRGDRTGTILYRIILYYMILCYIILHHTTYYYSTIYAIMNYYNYFVLAMLYS